MMKISFLVSGLAAVITLLGCPANAGDNTTDVTPMQVRLAYAGQGPLWKITACARTHGFVEYLGHLPDIDDYNNHVKITSLKPNTRYFYLPDNSGDVGPYTFKTSPFVADLGLMGPDGLTTHVGTGAANPLGPNDTNTLQSLQANLDDVEFLWHDGDIAYADYWLKEEIQGFIPNTTIADGYKVYESLLNQFYDEMMPITSQKAYMVGPGNHEANCDNGGTKDKAHNISYTVSICIPGQTNFTGYINHFRMPSDESNGLGNFWYSFDYGMVHYIQLDTETDLGHGLIGPDEPGGASKEDSGPFGSYQDAQLDWLKNDLASVDREKTPWVIVAGHRPLYASADSRSICDSCKTVWEPLFLNYSVDLYLSGHVHVYERSAPIQYGEVDPNELDNPSAPWYIVDGAAGHYDGLDTLVTPLQSYSRYAVDTAYGWSRLTFHNCSHLTHEFVASANGMVLDTATLFKKRSCEGDEGDDEQ